MGSFSIRLPIGHQPSEIFPEIPKSARRFLRDGFNVLSRLAPKYSDVLPSLIVQSVASGTEAEPAYISSKFGISDREARSFIGAVSFLALIISAPAEPEREETSQTVEGMLSAEIIEASAQSYVTTLLGALGREHSQVTGAFRRMSLANRLLPTLTDLELQVDVRLDFDKDRVITVVPVALVHLDTDGTGRELWFQMNKNQVEKAIEDLKRTLSRLEAAEKWAEGRSS